MEVRTWCYHRRGGVVLEGLVYDEFEVREVGLSMMMVRGALLRSEKVAGRGASRWLWWRWSRITGVVEVVCGMKLMRICVEAVWSLGGWYSLWKAYRGDAILDTGHSSTSAMVRARCGHEALHTQLGEEREGGREGRIEPSNAQSCVTLTSKTSPSWSRGHLDPERKVRRDFSCNILNAVAITEGSRLWERQQGTYHGDCLLLRQNNVRQVTEQ